MTPRAVAARPRARRPLCYNARASRGIGPSPGPATPSSSREPGPLADPIAYLDHAATAAPDAEALLEARPFLDGAWGNPSSAHRLGVDAERGLREARRRLAAALGAGRDAEVVLTGGGTEANNLAIRGLLRTRRREGRHVVASAVEHPSVLETCRDLERTGDATVSWIAPDADGMVDPERVVAAITDETVLVSIMHVQNETGMLHPVETIARAVKRARPDIAVHADGVQAFGKVRLALAEGGLDLYTISGHKIGAPKGIGALWIRPGTRLAPLVTGGGQESGLRSGTENVFGAVAFGAAAARATADLAAFEERIDALGARLRAGLVELGGVGNGAGVPWIVNVSFPGVKPEVALHALEERGVFVSTTSACASRKGKTSHVLAAMGLPDERIGSALRFSLGATSTGACVDAALTALAEVLPRVRRAGRAGRGRAARPARA